MKEDTTPFHTRGKFKVYVNKNVTWHFSSLEQALYTSARLNIKDIYKLSKGTWSLVDL